jgi:hypothetical protein
MYLQHFRQYQLQQAKKKARCYLFRPRLMLRFEYFVLPQLHRHRRLND